MKTIVITHHNEDFSWCNQYMDHFDERIIYQKGEKLKFDHNCCKTSYITTENVGLESNTILKYIIDNYHDLPDVVVFFQGMINDRAVHSILPFDYYLNCKNDEIIGNVRYQLKPLNWVYKNRLYVYHKYSDFLKHYGATPQKIFIKCNNMAIGKDVILSHSIEYYKDLLYNSGLSKYKWPAEGYYFENGNIAFFTRDLKYRILYDRNLSENRTNVKSDIQQGIGIKIMINTNDQAI